MGFSYSAILCLLAEWRFRTTDLWVTQFRKSACNETGVDIMKYLIFWVYYYLYDPFVTFRLSSEPLNYRLIDVNVC